MALEGSVADLHPQTAFLVGATFADKVQDLALAWRQGLDRANCLRFCVHVVRIACSRPPPDDFATICNGGFLLQRRFESVADSLHQYANPFGFAKRMLHDLLQRRTVTILGWKPIAVLAEIADIQQQCGQRAVQLMHDGGSHFVRRPCSLSRDVANCKFVCLHSAGTALGHCIGSLVEGSEFKLRLMASISSWKANGLRMQVDAPRCTAMPR